MTVSDRHLCYLCKMLVQRLQVSEVDSIHGHLEPILNSLLSELVVFGEIGALYLLELRIPFQKAKLFSLSLYPSETFLVRLWKFKLIVVLLVDAEA